MITRICLAMKKRGFGAGRWNGVGGKVNEDETIIQAAQREALEEIHVRVNNLFQVAELTFVFPDNPNWDQLVSVYFCESWQGVPSESDEMNPKWFPAIEIPFDQMWVDDVIWLPEVIAGNLVKAQFVFDTNDQILDQEMNIVKEFTKPHQ